MTDIKDQHISLLKGKLRRMEREVDSLRKMQLQLVQLARNNYEDKEIYSSDSYESLFESTSCDPLTKEKGKL